MSSLTSLWHLTALTRCPDLVDHFTASGIDPKGTYGANKSIVLPTEVKDTSALELVERYLGGTPFADLLLYPYPFTIPQEARFEHCHIVGGTGHGKTQLIQSLIYDDLYGNQENRPGICVIDSQGDLIQKLSHLGCFDPGNPHSLADKLVLIDPNDIEFPVCLNLFDFHLERVGSLPALQRETILNGTVDLFEYMFGALLGAELTQRQGLIFKYLARLLMTMPGANIQTLRELMEDGKKFKPHMDRLEGSTGAFFDTQFFSPSFNATKKQILTRLWGVLSNTTLERMFSHEKNKVDLFDAMNSGKIVLINTAKDLLKRDGCQILGRFFIALLGQAVLERAALSSEERRPFLVYIDEAHEYFDERVEELLNQARKYRVGLTLAHQTLDQLSPRLKAVFMANTSIKYAGGVSAKDAADFAREMHCTPEEITGNRKRSTYSEFSCFVRNVTNQAIHIKTPLGLIEQQPMLDEDQFQVLLSNNRDNYAAPAYQPKVATVPTIPLVDTERQPPPELTVSQPSLEEPKTTPKVESRKETVVEQPKPPEEPIRPMPKAPAVGRGGSQHTYLQGLVKKLAEERGYRATIEEQILGGAGSVDVSLTRGEKRIAVEISVTTSPEQELGNIQKCLATGYGSVFVLAQDKSHCRKLQQYAHKHLEKKLQGNVFFYLPDQFIEYLDQDEADQENTSSTVRGYKVKVKYNSINETERKYRRDAIAKVILGSMKRMKN